MTAVAPEPRLSDFFLSLADDPSLLEAYEHEPERRGDRGASR
jgi:hypothetical protein